MAAKARRRGDGHADRVHELGGDQAFTLAELAAEISAQAGQPVSYHDLPVAEYAQLLISARLPRAGRRDHRRRGPRPGSRHLYVDSGHLRQLIGRPTTSLHDAMAAALPRPALP
jgi:NAD(P)H dehydrogenase (quinone)